MSGNGYRFKREIALARANVLIEALRPACEQIEIAGSIRRGKETVGDIEIVAAPRYDERTIPGQLDLFGEGTPASIERVSLLDKGLKETLAERPAQIFRGRPHTAQKGRWGDKMKTLWARIGDGDGVSYIQVDLFIVTPPAQWGPIFTIRTGPEEFTGAGGLMAYINRKTHYQQLDGRLIVRATGEEVSTPTERSYFKALGLPWIEPGERTSAKLWQVVKAGTSVNGYQIAEPKPAVPETKTVKALTLHQPWASLIAAGLKQYETRSWPTSYRGLLAIHAGQQSGDFDLTAVLTDKERTKLPAELPSGAIVCIAHLVDVVKSEAISSDPEFEVSRESRLGNFAPGRYGWKLELVKVFDPPVPARGAQGLWNWEMPIAEPPTTEFPAPEKPRSSGIGYQIAQPGKRKILYTDEENRTFIRARLEMAAGIG